MQIGSLEKLFLIQHYILLIVTGKNKRLCPAPFTPVICTYLGIEDRTFIKIIVICDFLIVTVGEVSCFSNQNSEFQCHLHL